MSFCLYVIIKETWRIQAIILKQIRFICPFEIYMEISFSHSNWDDVNGQQRVKTGLPVYSGEFEHCKDICRSELRLIDKDVCENRKNLHSACQQVELSVLHLTTSICWTNTTELPSRERNTKGKKSHLRTTTLFGKSNVFLVWFQDIHTYTPAVRSLQSGLSLLPVWLLPAAGVCRVVSVWSGFSSGIHQARSLSVQVSFCTSDNNSIFLGISYFKWFFSCLFP